MLTSYEIKEISRLMAIEYRKLSDEVLNLPSVAEMLGKSEAAVKQMCNRKQLPYRKHLRTYYFSKFEITEFLLNCRDCSL